MCCLVISHEKLWEFNMSDTDGKEPEMNGLEESPEERDDVEMEEEELRIDFFKWFFIHVTRIDIYVEIGLPDLLFYTLLEVVSIGTYPFLSHVNSCEIFPVHLDAQYVVCYVRL